MPDLDSPERRQRSAGHQGADQDVGVDDQPHGSSGFAGVACARRGDGFLDRRFLFSGGRPANLLRASATIWSSTRHFTASSMTIENGLLQASCRDLR